MAIKHIISWAFAIILFFVGLVSLTFSPIGGTAFILIGIIILPKTSLVLKDKFNFDFTSKHKVILSITIFILLFSVDVALNPVQEKQPANKKPIPTKNTEIVEHNKEKTPNKPSLEFKQLGYNQNNAVENHYLLVNPEDKSENSLLSLANKIKKEVCNKPCNIMLYDEEKAYNLDMEREKIAYTNLYPDFKERQVKLDEFDKQHKTYLSEHFLGYLEFEGDDLFFYKPYKD